MILDKQNVADILPLTQAQKGLFFHYLNDPQAPLYIEQVELTLSGALNRELLAIACQELMAEHEALRSVFRWKGIKEAVQIVLKEWELPLIIADFSAEHTTAQEERIQEYKEKDAHQQFDLEALPYRFHLIKCTETKHRFIFTFHHILLDGWSLGILLREVLERYDCQVHQQRYSVHHKPNAKHFHQYLKSRPSETSSKAWGDYLQGLEAKLLVGKNEQANPATKDISYTQELLLPKRKIQAFIAEQKITFSSLFNAIWGLLLSKYLGTEEVVFGVVSANRTHDLNGIDHFVGMLAETLPFRMAVDGEQTIMAFLRQVRDHQDQWEQLISTSNNTLSAQASLDGTKELFNSIIAFENYPLDTKLLQNQRKLAVDAFAHHGQTHYDATITVETIEDIRLKLNIRQSIGDTFTATKMLGHFHQILQEFMADPQQKIKQIDMLAAMERSQILEGFNNKPVSYDGVKTLVDILRLPTEQYAEKVAVVFEDQQLTYKELDQKSNQLANFLIQRGISAGTLVGVCLDRSLDMIISLIGIVKAGGAYVPIDPAFPSDRIAFILADTAMQALLCEPKVMPLIRQLKEKPQQLWSTRDEAIGLASGDRPNPSIAENAPAYVIYTSGSTGRPKGVLNEHRGVVNRLLWGQDFFKLSVDDSVLQKTTFCFDVSIWELFWPLMVGAKLVFARPEGHKDAQYLKQIIEQESISTIHFVPSMLEAFLSEVEAGECESLKRVICSGEALKPKQVKHFADKFGTTKQYNLYGPTEAGIEVSYWEVDKATAEAGRVPIGKPVDNVQLYILDRMDQLSPVGTSGHLHIGGVQVARGYLNRVELTDDKFITDVFNPTYKMYRTGDQASWMEDGNIAYEGRLDDQVKIRGYRIELGEIENAINRSDKVQDCVVVAKEDHQGHPRLVAYLVPTDSYDQAALETYLMKKLPAYMVPAIWMKLERLPMNFNGKVDKKALPEPFVDIREQADFIAPSTETEEHLAIIWQELLGYESIGVHDNFFDLGGDSIVSIQVVSRAKRHGYNLKPKNLFEAQTIAELAELVSPQEVIPQAEQASLDGACPLLPIQSRFFDQEHLAPQHYNQGILLQLEREVNFEVLQKALSFVVEQHDALRFFYQPGGETWTQAYGSQRGEIEFVDLEGYSLDSGTSEITRLCQQAQESLRLEEGKIWNGIYFSTPGSFSHNRFFWVIHHLAVDGVSWRILLEDLEHCLEQLLAGKKPLFFPKTASYRQWSLALHELSESEKLVAQIPYWKSVVDDFRGISVDLTKPRVGTRVDLPIVLSEQMTNKLLTKVNATYHTEINDILLTALLLTVYQWTGEEQLHVGVEGHGRDTFADQFDLSRTVGWFTNLYPLKLVLEDSSASNLIKSVKEQIRVLPDKGMGYGLLRYLHPTKTVRNQLGTQQAFDIIFNYLGQVDNSVQGKYLKGIATEDPGKFISPDNNFGVKIEINGSLENGQLGFTWSFLDSDYRVETIQHLAKRYQENLQSLILHCSSQLETHKTPADFQLQGQISYTELDSFFARLQEKGISKSKIQSIYGLSPLQEGMLFHHMYEASPSAYVNQFICEFTGLNSTLFRECWEHVMQRHTILRTGFYFDETNKPLQAVIQDIKFPFEEFDYSNLTGWQQEQHITRFVGKDRDKGFDFSQPPLMRVSIFYLGTDRYRMVCTYHHIVCDGWSLPILLQEIRDYYNQLGAGSDNSSWPTDQFEDYIRYLEGGDVEQQRAFWTSYLSGFETPTLLPFVKATVDRNQWGGVVKKKTITLSPSVSEKLRQFAVRNRLTVNTILQGVWSYLLAYYTNQTEVVFGVTVSGRPSDLDQAEGRVGLYINTIPFRASLDSERQLSEWLQGLQEQHAQAREFQYTSLRSIQKWQGITGDFFDSILVFENYPNRHASSTDDLLQFSKLTIDEPTNYLVALTAALDEVLQIELEFKENLLPEPMAATILGHLEQLLQHIAATEQPLQLLDLNPLTPAESQQLLHEFNNTIAPYPKDKTIIEVFRDKVAETPEATAVVCLDQELTYLQLEQRSNQLAHYLLQQGIGGESPVIVCMDRSVEMLVAILAVFKAGGTYLPIDPDYPLVRIEQLAKDSQTVVLLTNANRLAKFNSIADLLVLAIDQEWEDIAQLSLSPPEVEVSMGDLAYIIYTSGSTGMPKGVMIEHEGMLNHLYEMIKVLEIDSNSKMLQNASPSFDISIWQFLAALLTGGTTMIYPKSLVLQVDQFIEHWLTDQLTHVQLVPSYLSLLYAEPGFLELDFPNLTYLIVTGEATPKKLVATWFEHFPDLPVINAYGPAEASDDITLAVMTELPKEDLLPIGRVIQNMQVYVFNQWMQLCPVGVLGEIGVAGIGLGRGYMNLPERTVQSFIPNPFEEEGLMYKTGDIGYWLPNGELVFIGRADNQVKINGHRIELGEIRTAMSKSGLIEEGVVVVKKDERENKRLVAYVVAVGEFPKAEMETYLAARLPRYMIPSIWVQLESMPLSPNGKIDRKALPAPANNSNSSDFEEPKTKAEVVMANIWAELLQLERVGLQDNFFELGGDSIVSIQVVSRARQAGYNIKAKDIFEFQTLADLVSQLGTEASETIQESGSLSGDVPLLPIQERFFASHYLRFDHYNQAVLFDLDKSVTNEEIEQIVEGLRWHHDALRLTYKKEEGVWRQYYGQTTGGVKVEDLGQVSTEALSRQLSIRCHRYQQQMNLEQGDLARFVFFRTSEQEPYNRLFIAIHHLAMDGVSWRILLGDMEMGIQTLRAGKALDFGVKGTSYRQWVEKVQQYIQQTTVQAEKTYWEKVTQAYQPLPVDRIGAEAFPTGQDDALIIQTLSTELTTALLTSAHLAYGTDVNDLLLTALAGVICQWTNQNQIVLGLEGHGREPIDEDVDTSRTIGWFTTIYPVCLNLTDASDSGQRIKQVKEQLRQVPGKGLAYGALRYMDARPSLSFQLADHQPWDIEFNYLGQFDNLFAESSWFQPAKEPIGRSISSANQRDAKLIINGQIIGGRLQLRWDFSSQQYYEETINCLTQAFEQELETLIGHCQKVDIPVPTPSDFGLQTELSIAELDAFLNTPMDKLDRRAQLKRLYPLSPVQEGMLFHSLYHEQAGAYIDQMLVEFQDLDIPSFRRSWEGLLAAHQVLRSAFYHAEFDLPLQAVYDKVELPFFEIDISDLSREEQEVWINNYLLKDREKGFDLTAPPLMRVHLLRLGESRHTMVWTCHHILTDGWSTPILLQGLFDQYKAFSTGNLPNPIEIDSYEDYIKFIQNKDQAASERFWTNYLKNFEQPSLLPFVSDQLERNKGGQSMQKETLTFDESFAEQLKAFSAKHHLTVNTLMQGVWAYILSRYTGQETVQFGVTVSGRPSDLARAERRVGPYINTIPLVSTLSEDATITQWLNHLQQDHATAREYQYTTLNMIQRWTGLQGDLFDSILVFENYPIGEDLIQEDTMKVGRVEVLERTNYLLTIAVSLRDTLTVAFKYNDLLLSEEVVQRMSGHFARVLEGVVSEAQKYISDLEILTAAEQQQLLVAFNATDAIYPQDKTLIELFEFQAKTREDDTALVFQGQEMSYAELSVKSSQLAHLLRKRGVVEGELVACCMDRSMEMLIAIFGILKAGAAYIPIDPGFPQNRIDYILKDSATAFVVSKSSVVGQDQSQLAEWIWLDELEEELRTFPTNLPAIFLTPDDLAYVLYTSGSTGMAKACNLSHRSLVNHNHWMWTQLKFTKADIVLQRTTFVFDASVWELFMPLCYGARLQLCDFESSFNPAMLLDVIEEGRITTVQFVPSVLQAFLEYLTPEHQQRIESLKRVFCGGEALHPSLVAQFKQKIDAELCNLYGPTEATIDVAYWRLPLAYDENSIVPIGKPVSNTHLFIYDKHGDLVPIGVTGELHVGGPQLAYGYLNRVELTADKFIPHPQDDRSKLYRTGDLARWRPDGNIEYIGRRDNQVKIRGYRIELGEIEYMICQYEGIKNAVVLVDEENGRSKRLVAYLIAPETFDRTGIERYLKQRLPNYMVPNIWVTLPTFPKTVNGKINRKALPKVSQEDRVRIAYLAPGSELEQELANVWQHLLQLEKIGVQDNFFELGGDSLLALRVIAAVQKKLSVTLTVKAIFEWPTIKELSDYISVVTESTPAQINTDPEEYEIIEL